MAKNDGKIRPEHQDLVAARFVNVTGLRCYNGGKYDHKKSLGIICPCADFRAGSGYNNGKSVVYLRDGTVWLSVGASWGMSTGASYVPCSNGEDITVHDLWNRIANPYWNDGEALDYSGPGGTSDPKPLGYMKSPADGEEIKKHPEFIAFCERVKKDSK